MLFFFGSIEKGKTTLINLICGTDFEISKSGSSLTRDV